jgi:hypothetical protein
VSAPWCVELEQDILIVLDHDVLVVLGDHNSDWTVLLLWDRLALNAWLDVASQEVIDELADGLLAEIADGALGCEWELLVLLCVLDGEGGPLADLEVEVAGVLTERLSVDRGEVELAFVLFGDWLEALGERLALVGLLGEDVGKRDASLDRRR